MGEHKGIFWGLVLVSMVLILTSLAPFASAAGIVLVDRNGTYEPGNVTSEFAAVHYEPGRENIGVVTTIGPSPKGFWIIPVPSSDFKAQPLSALPFFEGRELSLLANESLRHVFEGILAAQVLPLPVTSAWGNYYYPQNWLKKEDSTAPIGVIHAVGEDVDVIPNGKFDEYFAVRNVKLGNASKDLKGYESRGYSFAIAWFPESSTSVSRGLWINFKASEPHYPLALSSRYASIYPVNIYYTRHAYIPSEPNNGTFIVEQLYQPGYKQDSALFFGNKSSRDLEYTHFIFWSGKFNEDIKFQDVAKKDVAYMQSIVNHPIMWGLLIYLFISLVSSVVAGTVVFWGGNPHSFKFMLFGLNNFLTLPGFWARAYMEGVDESLTSYEHKINQWLEISKLQRFILALHAIALSILVLFIPISLFLELGPIFSPIFLSRTFLFWVIPLLVFSGLSLWGLFKQRKVLLFNIVFTATFLTLLFFAYVGMRQGL